MKTKNIFFVILLLCFPRLLFSEGVVLKGEDVKDKFEVQIKLLNGKNLPEYLKGAESTYEEDKYLLISVVNNLPQGIANFRLKITSKNNPNVKLILPIGVPSSVSGRTPAYYLYYLGDLFMVVPEEETQFEWEITDLFVH